jgi:hypothetical protein
VWRIGLHEHFFVVEVEAKSTVGTSDDVPRVTALRTNGLVTDFDVRFAVRTNHVVHNAFLIVDCARVVFTIKERPGGAVRALVERAAHGL